MDLGIKDQTALILGSTRGLGLGCALALVAEGVRVVINGRKTEHRHNALSKLGKNATFIQADLSSPAERIKLFESAKENLGKISILVTNADGPPTGEFLSKNSTEWQNSFNNIVLSAIEMANLCIPDMKQEGFGRIVNISSVSAKNMTNGSVLANSLKPALIAAFKSLSREVAEKGITVNSILPGPFNTDRMRRTKKGLADLSLEEAEKRHASEVPMKRMGTIEEFGALCAFLCSRQASYITGQSIVIDGGYVKSLL